MLKPSLTRPLVAMVVLAACRTAPPPPQNFAAIDRVLAEQREQLHIPGLAFAIVRDDKLVYITTQGMRDIEQKLPVTADTLFPIGSCTKAFTSMAIALAADQGLLTLDDRPRKFLSYFRMADPEADAQVTLRDMLSHRTGLKANGDLAAEPAVLSREDYIRAATSAKPTAKFRSAFQYSNAMYAAAGEIAGIVNHSTWERAIETQIFEPLAMTSSTTSTQRATTLPNHVTGYEYSNGSYRAVPPPRSLAALAPAGNIASTARDMTQWLRVLSGGGTIGGRRFVSPAMFRELTAPQIAISPTLSYALGWATYDWNGMRVIEHNGGSGGISALVSFIPERRAGFVFLANTSPTAMTKVGNAVRNIWPLILHLAAAAPPAAQTPAAEPPSAPRTPTPPIDVLLSKMVEALGGEANMRRHSSMEIRALKNYENQGVFADLLVQEREPSMHNEVETWTAAGKNIGTLRVYFDSAKGGQKTTFGQDEINDSDANMKARRDDALHPLLELMESYKSVTVADAGKVEDEPTWVVELTPEHGSASRLQVSQRTSLVRQREADGATTLFDDYRDVDGELVPFHTTIHDSLGESTIDVISVRFNVSIPDAAFQP